jgi:hypothetical protein
VVDQDAVLGKIQVQEIEARPWEAGVQKAILPLEFR